MHSMQRRRSRPGPAQDPERDNLLRLLARLPRNQQEAVRLFYLEDRSYEAVAESLGMPLGTVKNLLHRARKRLDRARAPRGGQGGMNITVMNGACEDYEFDVAELVDGTLAPEKARIVSLHLAGCARCRRWRDEYAAIDARLARALPQPRLAGGFRMEACRAPAGTSARTRAPTRAPPRSGSTPT